MRHRLSTRITIDAPTDVVWEVLTDLDGYADWNPFIIESSGRATLGERLTNRLRPPGGKARTFRPVVTEVRNGEVFEWLGRLGMPGLFDGRHRFELEPDGPRRTTFTQSEDFAGVLVPLMRSTLDADTTAGFEAMNAALKARAEARTGAGS